LNLKVLGRVGQQVCLSIVWFGNISFIILDWKGLENCSSWPFAIPRYNILNQPICIPPASFQLIPKNFQCCTHFLWKLQIRELSEAYSDESTSIFPNISDKIQRLNIIPTFSKQLIPNHPSRGPESISGRINIASLDMSIKTVTNLLHLNKFHQFHCSFFNFTVSLRIDSFI
jgi:hypothetical protein